MKMSFAGDGRWGGEAEDYRLEAGGRETGLG